MEVNKKEAEVNWQYPMMHKYQAEANKCPRMHWSPCHRMDLNKNHMEVNWQYLMVHKYHAEAN